MHIADPDQPVALDAVPEEFLHIQVRRVGGGVPDAVQLLIGAGEGADIVQIQIVEHALHRLELHHSFLLQQLDANKPEAGLVCLAGGEHPDVHHAVADGVVVGGVLFADGGECLHDRFAEPDVDIRAVVWSLRAPDHQAHAARKLNAEIQQDLCVRLAGLIAQRAVLACHQCDLIAALAEQCLRVAHVSLRQHDAARCQIPPCAGVCFLPVQGFEFFVDLHVCSVPFCHVALPMALPMAFHALFPAEGIPPGCLYCTISARCLSTGFGRISAAFAFFRRRGGVPPCRGGLLRRCRRPARGVPCLSPAYPAFGF